ncbi:MAG TPA: hypothetical protein VEA41_23875 [Salinarimonas sp.]|nr:hypothetical protein [Salinarimonas sp.]
MAEIKATATTTLKSVDALKTRAWAIVAALLAWALAQVWSTNEARLERLERPATERQR